MVILLHLAMTGFSSLRGASERSAQCRKRGVFDTKARLTRAQQEAQASGGWRTKRELLSETPFNATEQDKFPCLEDPPEAWMNKIM